MISDDGETKQNPYAGKVSPATEELLQIKDKHINTLEETVTILKEAVENLKHLVSSEEKHRQIVSSQLLFLFRSLAAIVKVTAVSDPHTTEALAPAIEFINKSEEVIESLGLNRTEEPTS